VEDLIENIIFVKLLTIKSSANSNMNRNSTTF